MRFFFDNCISYRIADALAALEDRDGHTIISLRQKFPEDCPDETWLPQLGREGGWVVISGDRRIYTNPQRRLVWASARITTFFQEAAWQSRSFTERQKAAKLLGAWGKIVQAAEESPPGTLLACPSKVTSEGCRKALVSSLTPDRYAQTPSPGPAPSRSPAAPARSGRAPLRRSPRVGSPGGDR